MPALWADRQLLSGQQWRSMAAFDNLGDARRTAVVLEVGDRLVELLKTLSDWVPNSVRCNGEDVLEISIKIVVPPLKDEEIDQKIGVVMDRANAVAELQQWAAQSKAVE